MAKDKISDYSSTANSNTDIAGINIDEGCAPSGINDAIRTLMAQLKTWQSGGQDVYIHPAGSASAPSITANGDTNTGIFFPAADTVAVTTGGTERARIDSSGNLGLGVTPSAWGSSRTIFQLGNTNSYVVGKENTVLGNNAFNDGTNWKYLTTGAAAHLYSQLSGGSHAWYTSSTGTAGANITFTQAMTLDASGNLMVGTTSSSSARLYVRGSGTTSSTASFEASNSSGATRLFVQDDGTTRFFGSSGSETARIDSSGNLLVGTTNSGQSAGVGAKVLPQGRFYAVGSGYDTFSHYNSSTSSYKFYISDAGLISAAYTSISAISDIRFKENVRDLNVGLAEVMSLRPRLYDWKEGKGAGTKNARGFIAQEFEEVFPDLIDEWKDPAPEGEEPYKSVRQDLIPVLVKAIQEQQAIITALTARIEALEQA